VLDVRYDISFPVSAGFLLVWYDILVAFEVVATVELRFRDKIDN